MKTEIKLEQAIGKTLQNIGISNTDESCQMVITFTDGTYITYETENGYGDSAASICAGELKMMDFDESELIRLDIIGREKLDALKKENADQRARQNEAWERQNFERLKTKFGV